MADIYSNYEELGRKVKSENPSLTFSDREAGLKFAKKFPHMVSVKETDDKTATRDVTDEPSWSDSFMGIDQSIQDFTNQIPGMGSLSPFLNDSGITGAIQGLASGATLGATNEIAKRLGGNVQDQGLAFAGGELAGEVLGPFKMINKALGPVKGAGMMAKAGRTALEGGLIEGGKGLSGAMIGEDSYSDAAAQGAVGYAASGIVDVALRGAFKGANKLSSKVFGVAEEDLNKYYMDFMRKHGQQILPTMAAPFSAVASRGQEILKESGASRRILMQSAQDLQKYAAGFKNNFMTRIGADTITKSKVGKEVVDSVVDQRNLLYSDSVQIYRDMINTNPKVKYAPIKATEDVIVTLEDGMSQGPYNIMQILNEAIEGFKKGEEPSGLIKLKRKVERLNEQHVTVTKEQVPRRAAGALLGDISEAQFTPAQSFGRKRFKASATGEAGDISGARAGKVYDTSLGQTQGGSRSSLQDPTNPGVLAGDATPEALEEAGKMVQQDYDEVLSYEHMTYDDWWKELQGIGRLIGDSSKKPQVKKKLQIIYHRIQDAIDHQAEVASPGSAIPIKLARNKYKMYSTFRDNPVIDKILDLGGATVEGSKSKRHKFSQVADEIFQDVDYIRDAKHVLEPEMYDMMRTTYIQDLVWGATELADKQLGTIERVDATKLLEGINNNKVNGLDGEFFKELFSDEGFSDVMGDPIAYKGNGQELLDNFKELVRLVSVTDVQSARLMPGSEGFSSAMAERFALGSVVADPAQKMGLIKTLVANLLAAKRTAKEYLDDPATNIFMQPGFNAQPGQGGISSGLIGESIKRQDLQSAVANRLMGPGVSAATGIGQ